MSFDKPTRNALAKMVSDCRRSLTADIRDQLQSVYGLQPDGSALPLESLGHLDEQQRLIATELRVWQGHLAATEPMEEAKKKAGAFERVAHETAFTVLNRLAALRMCEERGHVIECVRQGMESDGFVLYERFSGGVLGNRGETYRLFLRRMFEELAVDLGVVFDPRAPQSLVFPRERCLDEVLEFLTDESLAHLWKEDETIGWIYQYFNPKEEREAMRTASAAPRNSRELAVRNQFFTPRYVVEFLVDNTLGRIWYEMRRRETTLAEKCRYLVRRPKEIFLEEGEQAHDVPLQQDITQEELLKQPVYILHRPKKDPRDLKILDPAVGSGHFLLYAFDLLQLIYEEAWEDGKSPAFSATQGTLREDYPDFETLRRQLPELILKHNLHGIDIDLRACQIAALVLWLRAQRVWQEQSLKVAERPQIRRSNIVCAEPMPGEPEMLDEFASQLQPKVLGQLVRQVFGAMNMAGEAGSLLKIEEQIASAVAEAKMQWLKYPKPEQIRLFGDSRPVQQVLGFDFTGITDEAFWEEAEDRIYGALQVYAEQAENGAGFQRRLFADDAASGFAFIDLCHRRYDVVLMNPPFGLSQGELYAYLNREYPNSFIDLLASFVVRAKALAPSGFVGAITSRACLYTKTLLDWRTNQLSGRISALADLGIGVLDGAMVRSCAYVIPVGRSQIDGCFVDARKAEDKEAAILASLEAARSATPVITSLYFCDSAFFELIPQHRILYWLPRDFWQTIQSLPPIEPLAATIRAGLTTYDDFRFLRLRWEVIPSEIGRGNTWMFLSKGGYFGTFYNDVHIVVMWAREGREVGAYNRSLYKTDAQSRRGSSFYLRPAVTYSRRTDFFSARALPQNCFFADKGPAIIPLGDTTPAYLLGIFNSDLFRGLIHSQSQGGCFETGVLKLLPWSQPTVSESELIKMTAIAAWRVKASVFSLLEMDARFLSPVLFLMPSVAKCWSLVVDAVQRANADVSAKATTISCQVSMLFGLGSSNFEDLDVFETDHEIKEAAELILSPKGFLAAVVSYMCGVTFGRWDIQYATGKKLPPDLSDPFAPLPVCSPGMLQNEKGLPLTQEDMRRLQASGQGSDPFDITWDGILVDDPGHPLDIEARVRHVLEVLWKDRAEAIEQEGCAILDYKSLRDYFRRPTGFFADHLRRYSRSRRQAPVYWPLSTESGSYTLWIYYHRLNDDSLHTAVNKFVKPKIDASERRLRQIDAELPAAAGREATKLREESEELTALLVELTDFRDELLRVAGLPYKPNLDDGVLITASPLRKLFRLPKWRTDLEECWQKLASGEYDWAHMAYSIWPDRVRAACKKDHSIAIAHGFEDLCDVLPRVAKPKKVKVAITGDLALESEE